jgi:hypothetical protein
MRLGLLDPDPGPSVRGMDPDPDLDPSITKQRVRKALIPTALCLLFDFLSLKIMYIHVRYLPKVLSKKTCKKLVFG